ncbi:Trans-Golgi network integral membrane protein 2 [Pseudolycoriella hygida]|uniref:Trans-Golgi network integral membrane protein 2 n=1 Tax=Pseudolycoriella hygida TaxID=35572 RepID=A0A9Q0MY01_9DIPT|nr:Trans-Golgi network integral membrane protein 2 [Pseudolycoriella hygida]
MKSTNRRSHFIFANKTINYVKMCLLNCILISIVTLTQSLPAKNQSTQMTLSKAILQFPKFEATLLNSTVVEFVAQCEPFLPSTKDKKMCAPYFEMVKMLDDGNLDGLSTLDDFKKAMSLYDQTKVEDFCKTFPSIIPKDSVKYPESLQLATFMSKRCVGHCSNYPEPEKVDLLCRVFASGFNLSNKKSLGPTDVNRTENSAGSQIDLNQDLKALLPSVKAEEKVKAVSAISKSKPNITSRVAVVSANNVENEDSFPKENSSPSATSAPLSDKVVKGETELLHNFANDNQSPSVKPEVKPLDVGDSSEISIKDAQIETSNKNENLNANAQQNLTQNVKPAQHVNEQQHVNPAQTVNEQQNVNSAQHVNEQQILNPAPHVNEQQNVNPAQHVNEQTNNNDEKMSLEEVNDEDLSRDDEEKMNLKTGVTDDNFVDSELNGKINGDDSMDDVNDGLDDEDTPVIPQQEKASAQNIDPFINDDDSNFFTYFMFVLLVCVIAYVVYHNKSKMLALLLEGRRSSSNGRSGLSRRKHTAAYRKLDSNLEEAITSSANGRSTQVIY